MKRLVAPVVLLLAAVLVPPSFAGLPATPDPKGPTAESVTTAARIGTTTFMTGQFDEVGRATSPAVVTDAASGQLLRDLNVTGGIVRAVAADGAGGWWIGGNFDRVGGQPRAKLAHVLADGTLDPAFNVSVEGFGFIEGIALSSDGTKVIICGSFSGVAGQTRNRFAIIDIATGTPVGSDIG